MESIAETVTEALLARAQVSPDALAYVADGEAIAYAPLLADARQLAGRLAAQGMARGDRCALILPTGLDFIRAIYASQILAAIPVAIDPDLPVDAITWRLRLVRARLGLCTPGAASRLTQDARLVLPCPVMSIRDLARSSGTVGATTLPEPTDPAFLQFTSGSTGEPRAVVISHRSLTASLLATADRLEMRPDDVLATWVPLHHDLGLVRYVFGAMLSGCPSHLLRPSIANLRPWLELVARVRATITGGPDSVYRLAARTVDPDRPDRLNLESLRFAGNGGEPVRLATIEEFERRFGLTGVVRPAYGLSEATLTVTSTGPGEDLRIDETGMVSCGRPLRGIELRIAGSEGRPVPTGSAGEILVRGTAVFAGYFEDEEATRHALRDEWLFTGDIGSIDAQGYLFIKGRSRALIKRGGVTIAPFEIEDAVNRVQGVGACAAVGTVLSSLSQTEDVVVVAELSAKLPGTANDLESIMASINAEVRNAIGSAPGRILLVPAGTVPRTGAGKVRYEELRRMVIENAFAGGVLARW